jgi:LmbE family N-acetylglucosaminyl deacetylase
MFGSLLQYSELRFREASAALQSIPDCSVRRLTKPDESGFVDQHLFLDLPEAFTSFASIVDDFAPDLLISHAFEGGHIDHDACHILANRAAHSLHLPAFEFPLYWRSASGQDLFQKFRDERQGEFLLNLTEQELTRKLQMLAQYRSQHGLTSVFDLETERFRPLTPLDFSRVSWRDYPFENRRKPLATATFLQKVSDFSGDLALTALNRQVV